jgi:hypothetical protein
MNSALSTLPHPVSSKHVKLVAESFLCTAKDGESDPTVLERMALLELQIRPDSNLLPYRVKAFGLTIKLAGASGTISDHSPCYTWSAADVQSFDVVGSRSKRSNCASDDEADARRQKRPARSKFNGQRKDKRGFRSYRKSSGWCFRE